MLVKVSGNHAELDLDVLEILYESWPEHLGLERLFFPPMVAMNHRKKSGFQISLETIGSSETSSALSEHSDNSSFLLSLFPKSLPCLHICSAPPFSSAKSFFNEIVQLGRYASLLRSVF